MIAALASIAGVVGIGCLVAGVRLERREQDRTTGEPPGRTRTGE